MLGRLVQDAKPMPLPRGDGGLELGKAMDGGGRMLRQVLLAGEDESEGC